MNFIIQWDAKSREASPAPVAQFAVQIGEIFRLGKN
jgi:hypothetical protein